MADIIIKIEHVPKEIKTLQKKANAAYKLAAKKAEKIGKILAEKEKPEEKESGTK